MMDFKTAVKKMTDDGEFERIKNWYKRGGNHRAAREVKVEADTIEAIDKRVGIENAPFLVLLHEIKDPEALKDIICYMSGDIGGKGSDEKPER